MMNAIRVLLLMTIIGLLVKNVTLNGSVKNYKEQHAQGSKRVVSNTDNAFANDINKCLFTGWTTASGNQNAVLSGPVECKGQGGTAVQLCYGTEPPVAQFAVCYNTNTLTPDFTGHIVRANIGSGRDSNWRTDQGKFAPNPQSAIADYEPYSQRGLYDNFDTQKEFFCSRGHFTPNADFSSDEKRSLTFIMTNAAPQWQKFNNGNWAKLEKAVREYATKNNRNVYVFTGVGGKALNPQRVEIMLGNRVLAPRWYWKAVCDPVAKQSIVFVGENAIGVADSTKVVGCSSEMYTRNAGVIYCHSLDEARKSNKYNDFKLPPFNKKCNPSQRGVFMDNELKNNFV